MKVDPTQRSDGTGNENVKHVTNPLVSQRGIRKVLRNAVLQGTRIARMPAPLVPRVPIMGSCKNESATHDSRKYAALSAQASNKDR